MLIVFSDPNSRRYRTDYQVGAGATPATPISGYQHKVTAFSHLWIA